MPENARVSARAQAAGAGGGVDVDLEGAAFEDVEVEWLVWRVLQVKGEVLVLKIGGGAGFDGVRGEGVGRFAW